MFEKRCALCSTTNKKNSKLICDECLFIKDFIIKYGRENIRYLITNFYNNHANSQFQTPLNNFMHVQQPHELQSTYIAQYTEPSAPSYNTLNCRTCMNASCSCKQRNLSIRKD